MDNKSFTPLIRTCTHKAIQKLKAFLFINANATFHRNRNINRLNHCANTIRNMIRLFHKARAKRSALHPITRAPAIQVHFVIAMLCTHLRTPCKIICVRPAKLQGDRMFGFIKA